MFKNRSKISKWGALTSKKSFEMKTNGADQREVSEFFDIVTIVNEIFLRK